MITYMEDNFRRYDEGYTGRCVFTGVACPSGFKRGDCRHCNIPLYYAIKEKVKE